MFLKVFILLIFFVINIMIIIIKCNTFLQHDGAYLHNNFKKNSKKEKTLATLAQIHYSLTQVSVWL